MRGMQKPQALVAGLILAAGAGSRYGMPKALVHDESGESWLRHAVDVLRAAGCSPVIVVLGAHGAEAAVVLDPALNKNSVPVVVVQAPDWSEGLSASLRAGLKRATEEAGPVAVAVIPVDVPDLNAATVLRVIGSSRADTGGPAVASADTLRQARFSGRPGHPVVLGRAHWEPLIHTLAGDTGAQPYLRTHDVESIECGDLGTGLDVDRPTSG